MPRAITKQGVGLVLGSAVFLAILLTADLQPGNPIVTRTAAVATLMAIWWITEAIPIPATALLPVVLFPLMGIMDGRAVAATYYNHIIFLFIGGFVMALAMQKWRLHRRIALAIILLIGTSPKRILLGFMTATAFLSMWISNTATTMMMVPIALAIISRMKEEDTSGSAARFSMALLLGIAYAASIGGIATLIGTPPNLAFGKIFHTLFPAGPEITFAGWMVFGVPFSTVFLTIAWSLLVFLHVRHTPKLSGDSSLFRLEYKRLGPMSYEEKVVSALFILLALLWLFRSTIVIGSITIPGWSNLFAAPAYIDDGSVAITVSLILYLIPSKSEPGTRLMDWETAARLNWGIVVLFGGGFALAAGFKESGLSAWAADQLVGLESVGPLTMVASVAMLLTFLTELTSNTATTQIVLPLLGSLAVAIKTNPLLLMIPATISASCAFMLPVATPPNAIVFGSGEIKMSDMIRVGIYLNLIGVVMVTAFLYLLGLYVFSIVPGELPLWATP